MKPQRFEIGQPVTPKKIGTIHPKLKTSPRMGEIYHVIEYASGNNVPQAWPNEWYIRFKEIRGWHIEKNYDPIDLTTEQITELVEEALTEKV